MEKSLLSMSVCIFFFVFDMLFKRLVEKINKYEMEIEN